MAKYKEVAGLPFKVSENQAEALAGSGIQHRAVTPEMAQQSAQALGEIQQAEEDYGTAGAAALGGFSGLTMGVGPGVAAALGFLDPNAVSALQTTGAYTAGDVAGTVLPAFFTGGENIAARGLLGSALRSTPAGLMGRAGGLAEHLASRLLPGAGGIAKSAIGMAARGATEGALINVGHTIGDSLIQNKPLSAEALWAAGTDGALAGGLMGGGLGLVGGVGSRLVEALPGAVQKAGGAISEKGLGSVARRLGMSAEQVEEAQATGTLADTLKSYRGLLDKQGEGVTYGSSTGRLKESASRAGRVGEIARDSVVELLDKQAPLAVPVPQRVGAVINKELLEPIRNVPLAGREATQFLDGYTEQLFKAKSWKDWVGGRDALEAGIKAGKFSGLQDRLAKDALRITDREIESSIKGAEVLLKEPGLADKFTAAQLDVKLSKELGEMVGKKQARDILSHETTFTPRDISVLGGMAIVGNPALAAGWAAAKGIGRRINAWAEPAMAEMAYQRSIGARAASAQQQAQFRIRESIRNFFRRSSEVARKGYSVKQAEDRAYKGQVYSRKDYENAASRAEQLVSANHQAKVSELLMALENNNYGQLAKALADTNLRATQYVSSNLPPRRAVQSLGSLRDTPKIHGLDMREFKFIRQMTGVSDPFALLEHLEDGSLGRDEVRAMKFVYPELHNEIVTAAAEHIQELKASGEGMPMDKIAQLGIVLDSPIDTMLDRSRIGPIQASFIPPEQPQPQQPSEPVFSATSLQTPVESLA